MSYKPCNNIIIIMDTNYNIIIEPIDIDDVIKYDTSRFK